MEKVSKKVFSKIFLTLLIALVGVIPADAKVQEPCMALATTSQSGPLVPSKKSVIAPVIVNDVRDEGIEEEPDEVVVTSSLVQCIQDEQRIQRPQQLTPAQQGVDHQLQMLLAQMVQQQIAAASNATLGKRAQGSFDTLTEEERALVENLQKKMKLIELQGKQPSNSQRVLNLCFETGHTILKVSPQIVQIFLIERLCQVMYEVLDIKKQFLALEFASGAGKIVLAGAAALIAGTAGAPVAAGVGLAATATGGIWWLLGML